MPAYKPSITYDYKKLASVIAGYAAATRISVKEAVRYAARQVAQHAQKETILITGRGIRGRASTVAQAKREQQERWQSWILVMGFPRMGWSDRRFTAWKAKSYKSMAMRQHWFKKRMPERERKRYFSVAKKLQGRLAAGWNAAIGATGGKYAAAWVKRHGNLFSKYEESQSSYQNGFLAEITFVNRLGKTQSIPLRDIAELAVKKTMHGMKNAVEKIIKNTARKKRRH